MKKYAKGELVKIILSTLLAVGVIKVAVVAPNVFQVFKYFKPKNAYERKRIKQSITRLEQRKFIRKDRKSRDGYFILTYAGKIRAMRYQIETMKIPRQNKWDGKWRNVMFDIPEEKKMIRRAINHSLKKIGCVQYQKSVFITPFLCKKEIDFVGGCFGVRHNMRLILAENIEIENNFKKTFNL